MKRCKKCGVEKPRDRHNFYANSGMADGFANVCIECTAKGRKAYYLANRPRLLAGFKIRSQDTTRKACKSASDRRNRENHPDRIAARKLITHALEKGTITRQPCEVCADPKTEAHHDDYTKPMSVRWLCFKHHRQLHGQQVG